MAAVILYACRMLFPGVLKKDYKKRFRAAFVSPEAKDGGGYR